MRIGLPAAVVWLFALAAGWAEPAREAPTPEVLGKWIGQLGHERYPFRHLIAAGDMGKGRWLVIWEQGGIALFSNVEVFKLTAGSGGRVTATRLVSVQGGPVEPLCRQAAAELSR